LLLSRHFSRVRLLTGGAGGWECLDQQLTDLAVPLLEHGDRSGALRGDDVILDMAVARGQQRQLTAWIGVRAWHDR
jgi:hypothetical protein